MLYKKNQEYREILFRKKSKRINVFKLHEDKMDTKKYNSLNRKCFPQSKNQVPGNLSSNLISDKMSKNTSSK